MPPTVVVRGAYPGANPKVIAETVASPLEQQINGVEDMLYMFSQSTADGVMTLTVTFALGTDLDNAQVQVQNRVAQALPRLPQEVQRIGVVTEKASPDFMMVVHLVSPDERYDMLYLSNFAHLQVKDELAADRRRRQRPGLRRRRIQHAGLARSRQPGRAADDRHRRRARDPRAEPAGRGRRARRAAGADRHGLSAVDQRAGPAEYRRRIREHRRARHARRPDHQAEGRRPRRAGLEQLRAAEPARQPAGGGDRHLPAARQQRHRGRRRRCARRWRR